MIVLRQLWFLILCVLLGVFAPSRADARLAETRTWVFAPEVAQTRLETEPQAVGTHQENGLWNYEHARGCTQAAENVVRPASSPHYSVLQRVELRPGTLSASDGNHFRQGNRQVHEMMQADPKIAARIEAQFPGVTSHVTPGPRGGFADTSPPGLTWHHHPDKPGVLELVPRPQHQAGGPVQGSLHPGGTGGRENWGGGRRRP